MPIKFDFFVTYTPEFDNFFSEQTIFVKLYTLLIIVCMIFRHLKRIIKCHISSTKEKVNIYFGVQFERTIDNNVTTVTPEANNLKTFPEAFRPSTEKKGDLI